MLAAFLSLIIVGFLALIAIPAQAAQTSRLAEFLPKVQASELFPGADRFGELLSGEKDGEPAIVPVYRGDELLGHAFLNSDFTSSIGYSGKPIHIIAGLDQDGVLRGLKMVEHQEPIVLVGIPEEQVIDSLNALIDRDIGRVSRGEERPPQVDIVSGATVTVLVMGDSVVRASVRLIRSGRLGGDGALQVAAPAEIRSVDMENREVKDWTTLTGDGSVRTLQLNVGEVTQAFERAGEKQAASRPESDNPDDSFIELYVAPVSVPSIGISLLGQTGYDRLAKRLKDGRQAILVAGDGAYSFKGSGYVRGGIFDRIELLQAGQGVRFRDRNHSRLSGIVADGAPRLREVALFTVPEDFVFDVTEPWEIQLLAQRAWGARDKAATFFNIGYSLPASYVNVEAAPAPTPAPAPATEAAPVPAAPVQAETPATGDGPIVTFDDEEEPLWVKMWRMNSVSISITVIALLVLTAIFFFQDWLSARPALRVWVRRSYLLFTLVWLGWYANAQLSVVNVFTFTNALMTGFHWEFFLSAPLIFILWAAVAVGLLFWGRGPFCGWLCPFGALQELTNTLAKWCKVPQITVPFWLHERLWPIKYIIFLGLFGLSLYSLVLAEMFAEIEPFKTSIILKFAREWPFVIFALTLLTIGLFIERFYCRYLCPLGAALAIPGRIRMFEWLKRWPECGSPCQRCAKECPVQSIHPEGQINVNECIYCMHCQELYHDDQRCPHMIQVRLKREKFERLSSPSTGGPASGGKGPAQPIISHKGMPIRKPGNTPPTTTTTTATTSPGQAT